MGDSVVSALIWARSSRSGLGAQAVRALLQAAAMPKTTSLPDAVKKFGQSCHLPGASREACCWHEWGWSSLLVAPSSANMLTPNRPQAMLFVLVWFGSPEYAGDSLSRRRLSAACMCPRCVRGSGVRHGSGVQLYQCGT